MSVCVCKTKQRGCSRYIFSIRRVYPGGAHMAPASEALYLGSELKHLHRRVTKWIHDVVPRKPTREALLALTHAVEVRSLLEDALFTAVGGASAGADLERAAVHDGGKNFRERVPLIRVFYGKCACRHCEATSRAVYDWRGRRRSNPPTRTELDAYVRLRAGLCAWTSQAKRFVAGLGPSAPFKRRWRSSMRTRTTRLLDGMEETSRSMLCHLEAPHVARRLRAPRAAIHWAIVRVAVQKWRVACFLYEAKVGPGYEPGGEAARRAGSEALAALPFRC